MRRFWRTWIEIFRRGIISLIFTLITIKGKISLPNPRDLLSFIINPIDNNKNQKNVIINIAEKQFTLLNLR